MKQEYQKRVKAYLLDHKWYKLVDCLEDVSNYWSFGRNYTSMPTYNTFMPMRYHVLDKPSMLDGDKDDLGFQFRAHRISPAGYLNTLKGNKMMPQAAPVARLKEDKNRRGQVTTRRLGSARHKGFSTLVERPSGPMGQRPTFLSSILSQSGLFGCEQSPNGAHFRR